ncbi:hypothetical protein CALCODRAFT_206373 [Calocera cornea HHB12733]|uniref:Uncharacterized protein n=1 Tax=Calocera cornea HHB12733 TaxID=1353952 RepID=A0A165K1P0_9BASI|nr:hypothetical protein CALCODRAFT_206373 [Calocera cornea HHB12733]
MDVLSRKLECLVRNWSTPAATPHAMRHHSDSVSINAPIHTLPDEVLSYIFELGSEHGKMVQFSIVASHICQRWRTVALPTAVLWSDINLELPLRKVRKRYCSGFQDIASRTAVRPIDLSINLASNATEQQMGDSLRFLKRQVSASDHVGKITRNPTNSCTSLFTLDFIPRSLSTRIRSLTLTHGGWYFDGPTLAYLLGALGHCHALEVLILNGVYLEDHNIWNEPVDVTRKRVVSLPKLREICLYDTDNVCESACCSLLLCVDAPITSLAFYLPEADIPIHWYRRIAFLASVRTLNLRCTFLTKFSTIIEILSNMPNLDAVSLEGWHEVQQPCSAIQIADHYTTGLKQVHLDHVGKPGATQALMEGLARHGLPHSVADGKLDISLSILCKDSAQIFDDKCEGWVWIRRNVRAVSCQ